MQSTELFQRGFTHTANIFEALIAELEKKMGSLVYKITKLEQHAEESMAKVSRLLE